MPHARLARRQLVKFYNFLLVNEIAVELSGYIRGSFVKEDTKISSPERLHVAKIRFLDPKNMLSKFPKMDIPSSGQPIVSSTSRAIPSINLASISRSGPPQAGYLISHITKHARRMSVSVSDKSLNGTM